MHACTRAHGTRADFFFGMYQLETRFARIIRLCVTHTAAVFTPVFVFELKGTWDAVFCHDHVYRSRIIRCLSTSYHIPGIKVGTIVLWPSYHIALTAQRQQQQRSIAILVGSREGSRTYTAHTVLWRYGFRRPSLPLSSCKYHYRTYKTMPWFVRSQSIP